MLLKIGEIRVKSGRRELDEGQVDGAEKTGVTPRTVRNRIHTAKMLTQEAKEVIKDKNMKINGRETRKLSKLEPEEQKEAAKMLADGEIRSVDEYIKKEQKTEDEADRYVKGG